MVKSKDQSSDSPYKRAYMFNKTVERPFISAVTPQDMNDSGTIIPSLLRVVNWLFNYSPYQPAEWLGLLKQAENW